MIKELVREFNLSWKFMCTDKNNVQNKTNLPPPPSVLFLIFEKLLNHLL